ncbi:MAG: carboxymuconolactone decarboxylase family protein [Candidatus Thermoplasmatota archaeon]|nr:carboxymuconolactone decarboxylase family protein [Candidatus Thermoplasmatota archaeon]
MEKKRGLKQGFPKRRYASPSELLDDVIFLAKNARRLRRALGGAAIPKKTREKLMLAVTGVNGCKYCSFGHTMTALKQGISPQEAKELLDGKLTTVGGRWDRAILYSQHWAETGGKTDPEAEEAFSRFYEPSEADELRLLIRAINFGNMVGNTWDYVAWRITRGKMGG